MIRPFKKIKEETLFENPYWRAVRGTFELPDGSEKVFEYAAVGDAVMVVVINDEGKILLQKQFRPFVMDTLLQFPAGGLEGDEKPADAAARELAEESGLGSRHLVNIGMFYPSAGGIDRRAYIFIARDLYKNTAEGDEFELEHEWKTPEEIDALIANNEMKDAWAIASWAMAKPHL